MIKLKNICLLKILYILMLTPIGHTDSIEAIERIVLAGELNSSHDLFHIEYERNNNIIKLIQNKYFVSTQPLTNYQDIVFWYGYQINIIDLQSKERIDVEHVDTRGLHMRSPSVPVEEWMIAVNGETIHLNNATGTFEADGYQMGYEAKRAYVDHQNSLIPVLVERHLTDPYYFIDLAIGIWDRDGNLIFENFENIDINEAYIDKNIYLTMREFYFAYSPQEKFLVYRYFNWQLDILFGTFKQKFGHKIPFAKVLRMSDFTYIPADRDVAFTSDERYMVTARENVPTLIDTRTLEEIHQYEIEDQMVACTISEDDQTLFVATVMELESDEMGQLPTAKIFEFPLSLPNTVEDWCLQ